ncbi:hypothetical protein [Cytobacillus oceanisediminis]|uniref:hypothetical protein n=1 Tax=Cytobacillus oceanisediminis TaxID=665099 RepID=UPI00203A413F|nr:hypothetical protein [Cytobacillus oceanisediminis]MCM3405934.1 hypothetical protein [Cytobacillus oceanisediminis]
MKNFLRKVSFVSNKKKTWSLKEFANVPKSGEINQRNFEPIAQRNFSPGSKLSTTPHNCGRVNFYQSKDGPDSQLKVQPPKLAPGESFLKFRGDNAKLRRPIYSLYFNPAAFFDPTFILIGCGVVAVAVLEKKMAENGLVSIASFLSTVLRLALPGVALGSIIYLINHSSFLL